MESNQPIHDSCMDMVRSFKEFLTEIKPHIPQKTKDIKEEVKKQIDDLNKAYAEINDKIESLKSLMKEILNEYEIIKISEFLRKFLDYANIITQDCQSFINGLLAINYWQFAYREQLLDLLERKLLIPNANIVKIYLNIINI